MNPLRILALAAALLAAGLARPASASSQDMESDPEYQRILAELRANPPMVLLPGKEEEWARLNARIQWEEAQQAAAEDPKQQGDFLKGDAVQPEDPATAQQAFKELGAVEAIAAGNSMKAQGDMLANLPFAGLVPFSMFNAAGEMMSLAGEKQAKGGQETLDTFKELQAAINDYNKVLDAAKKEGIPVGDGYTITTFTGPDGKLMQSINTPNSCGIPFLAGSPPPSWREDMKKMLADIAKEKEKVAKAKAELAKQKEELLAANSKAFDKQSCLNCGETPPAPGEDEPVDASDTEDSGSPDESGAAPGDEKSAAGQPDGKGKNLDSAGHQADLVSSAITQTPVAGITIKNPLTDGFGGMSLASYKPNSKPMEQLLIMGRNNTMSNRELKIPDNSNWLESLIPDIWAKTFDNNQAAPVQRELAPADSIFPTKSPAAPGKPSRGPADNKGT